MLGRHGNNPQEEEDECLGDRAEHLDHVADGCAGSLGNVLLCVVLCDQSAGHNPRKHDDIKVCFCCRALRRKTSIILGSTHAVTEEMAKSSASR